MDRSTPRLKIRNIDKLTLNGELFLDCEQLDGLAVRQFPENIVNANAYDIFFDSDLHPIFRHEFDEEMRDYSMYHAQINQIEHLQSLKSIRWNDFDEQLACLSTAQSFELNNQSINVKSLWARNLKTGIECIYTSFTINLFEWANSFSVSEFINEMLNIFESNGAVPHFNQGDFDKDNIFNVESRDPHDSCKHYVIYNDLSSFTSINLSSTEGFCFESGILDYASELMDCAKQAASNLRNWKNSQTFLKEFYFPESVRIPCEQYLIYFVDFLKQLGIDATANINHEGSQVLFSVIPASDDVALKNIRDALDIYLNLPRASNSNPDFGRNASIQERQILANVNFLQGQLYQAMAQIDLQAATIEHQQATIGLLNKTIDLHQQIQNGTLLASSHAATQSSTKSSDTEPLIPGMVDIRNVSWGCFDLGLAEVMRRLKKKFSSSKEAIPPSDSGPSSPGQLPGPSNSE